MSNINDFIKLLDINVNENVNVFVPSLGETVGCKPFTVPQQKEVIKSTLNGIKGNITLPRVFNNIVLENLQTDKVPLIVDRNAILVQLRIMSLGTVIYDDSGEKTDLQFKEEELPIPSSTTINDSGITVTLSIPTVKKDNEYINILEGREYETAGDIVNDLYIFEVAKYIDKIEFQGQAASPSVKDSIVLVNKLPLSLNDKILQYIKTVKDYENTVLTAENGSPVSLNARFFNTTE